MTRHRAAARSQALPPAAGKLPLPEVVAETRLIKGLSLEKASRLVADKAAAQLALDPNAEVGIWTETGNTSVLVGIARRGKATSTMLVPRNEYDGLKLLAMLGAGHG